jgi:hypothetical protein
MGKKDFSEKPYVQSTQRPVTLGRRQCSDAR